MAFWLIRILMTIFPTFLYFPSFLTIILIYYIRNKK